MPGQGNPGPTATSAEPHDRVSLSQGLGTVLFIVTKPACNQSCLTGPHASEEKGQHIGHTPDHGNKRSDAKGNTTRFTQTAGHSWSSAGTTYSDRA